MAELCQVQGLPTLPAAGRHCDLQGTWTVDRRTQWRRGREIQTVEALAFGCPQAQVTGQLPAGSPPLPGLVRQHRVRYFSRDGGPVEIRLGIIPVRHADGTVQDTAPPALAPARCLTQPYRRHLAARIDGDAALTELARREQIDRRQLIQLKRHWHEL